MSFSPFAALARRASPNTLEGATSLWDFHTLKEREAGLRAFLDLNASGGASVLTQSAYAAQVCLSNRTYARKGFILRRLPAARALGALAASGVYPGNFSQMSLVLGSVPL
jgi:hypothetical protein